MVHSILTGGILIVMTFWVWYLYVYLWRLYFLESCSEAMSICEQQGFQFVSSALRAEVEMRRAADRICWKGGWSGERTLVRRDGLSQWYSLIQNADDAERLSDLWDPTSTLQSD